jgi:tetratricopeptide (TPR) repeat protein
VSYELLEPEEQGLFARLSVFSGGCTLEAAGDVADAELDPLQSLVEKSLLRFTDERYSMLETIREYAQETFGDAAAAIVRRRHRRYMVARAEASASRLHDAGESGESERLGLDHANIRDAVSHALECVEPDDAGRILGAIYPYLISRALSESREWADATLALRDHLSTTALAETLVAAGEIARFAGDLALAIELKEELVSVDADVRRPNWKAAVLVDLCEIALDQGDYRRAREYAERSAAEGGSARSSLGFAELALRLGDLEDAESRGNEALAGFEERSFNGACALEILGEVARRSGDATLARVRFSTALRWFAEIRDAGGTADCLDGLARLAAEAGEVERADALMRSAKRLREESGRRPMRTDVPLPTAPNQMSARTPVLGFDAAIEYALATID